MSAPASSWTRLATHRAWLDAEAARLLDFARGSRVPGGFAWLDDRGEPDPARPLQLWITARMTHVFALGELLGHPGCGALADHGLAALRGAFEDREHGGWYSELAAGGPVRTDKEAYPHSFVLLAAASGVLAGRARAGALLEVAVRGGRGAVLVRGRGRRAWRPGTGPGASPRPTAARTPTCTWSRRSWRPATPPATPSGTTARCGSPSASSTRRARPGVADRRALRRRLAAAAGVQRGPAEPPVPALRRHARPRLRVVAPAPAAPRGRAVAARLAARGLARAVRPGHGGRLARARRLRLHDRRRGPPGRHRPPPLGRVRGDRRGRRAARGDGRARVRAALPHAPGTSPPCT